MGLNSQMRDNIQMVQNFTQMELKFVIRKSWF